MEVLIVLSEIKSSNSGLGDKKTTIEQVSKDNWEMKYGHLHKAVAGEGKVPGLEIGDKQALSIWQQKVFFTGTSNFVPVLYWLMRLNAY